MMQVGKPAQTEGTLQGFPSLLSAWTVFILGLQVPPLTVLSGRPRDLISLYLGGSARLLPEQGNGQRAEAR